MNNDNVVAVFWDWNGTLLDDRAYNIACINDVMKKYGKETIDEERYFATFGFPVIDFYRKMGFDFEKDDYIAVADSYIKRYNAGADGVPLRKGAAEAIAVYADKGIRQYILTASEKKIVERALECRGISKYFSAVLGLDNFLAGGKTEVGRKFLAENPLGGKAVMIGDTLHDCETAKELSMECVLLRGGHASDDKLKGLNVPVVDAPNQTYRYVLPKGRGFVRKTLDTSFVSHYKAFYDDLKNTNKTEDW